MYTTLLDETGRPPATARTNRRPSAPPLPRPDRTASVAAPADDRTTAGRDAVLALPAEVRWVPVVRRCVVAVLTQWRFPSDARDSAELIVGELAANAAEHGRDDMTVRLCLHGGVLWISVTDSGAPASPPVPRSADLEEHGRGLSIVEFLAARLRVHQGPWGRQVDAALPVAAPDADSVEAAA
ncbi:anti-sigma regulatory factor (Ser/Thr protein kinase) [Streptomyces sp. SAI-170]|uniref:ATP-binding protein n=1 Tax=Streptomyces sp. SAI-170 TaxID=3377729 RepID=UPI003C7BECA0